MVCIAILGYVLLERDFQIIQTDICDFVTFLRQNKISYATISLYVAAIKKFYDMNDIGNMINWRKVRHFMGEHEKVEEDKNLTIRRYNSYTR